MSTFYTANKYLLGLIELPKQIHTNCSNCGVSHGDGWKCEFCDTTFEDVAKLKGKPLSKKEFEQIMEGETLSEELIEEISKRE